MAGHSVKATWPQEEVWDCTQVSRLQKRELLLDLCVHVSRSVVSDSFAALWTVAWAPLSIGCFRQSYWSGHALLEDLPTQGSIPTASLMSLVGRQVLYC